MAAVREQALIWTVGSGKGGVGKTLLAANLGILAAAAGRRVVLVDGDLGASNLHTALGIPYLRRTLNDLVSGAAAGLEGVVEKTPHPRLSLVGGSRELPAHASYRAEVTRRLVREVPGLDADLVIVDLAAGTAAQVLDLFLLAPRGIVVLTPDPASIQNAYQFLKAALFRRILAAFPRNPLVAYMVHAASRPGGRDRIASVPELVEKISKVDRYYGEVLTRVVEGFAPRVVVNMVRDAEEERAATILSAVTQKFLGIRPTLAGTLPLDPAVQEAARGLRPVVLEPACRRAAEQIHLLAQALSAPEEEPAAEEGPRAGETGEVWLMDNVEYRERPLYVLTEKLNRAAAVQTSIYHRGRILFSRKVDYPELRDGGTDPATLQRLVRRQHLAALKGIERGRLSLPEAGDPSADA